MTGLGLRKGVKDNKRDKILEEIKLVKSQLHNASTRFDLESDSDLVEATIYEMEALKAKYRHLLKLAKQNEFLEK